MTPEIRGIKIKKRKFSCYHCLTDATYINFTIHQPGTEHYPLFRLGLICFLRPGGGGGGREVGRCMHWKPTSLTTKPLMIQPLK